MTAHELLQIVLSAIAILAAAWGFWTGWLPRRIRSIIGFHELEESVERIRENTENLEAQHAETIEEMNTLKHGQIALAEAVENEHNTVAVQELRQAHFGNQNTPHDFLRGQNADDSD